MNPSSTSPNQGTSINFDAQALHDADEAEYQREEVERQNELRQLLTCAFDCDLSEEEDSLEENASENTSQNLSQHQSDQGENWHRNVHYAGHGEMYGAHASTPVNGMAPPLQTPATVNQYQYPEQARNAYMLDQPQHQFEGHQLIQRPYLGPAVESQAFVMSQEGMASERGVVEGGNVNDPVQQHVLPSHPQYTAVDYQGFQYRQRPDVYEGQEAEQMAMYNTPTTQQDIDSRGQHPPPRHTDVHSPREGQPQYNQYPNKELEHFKVQYTGAGRADLSTDSVDDTMNSEAGSTMPRPTTPGDDGLQKDFLAPDGTSDGRHFNQLEILYRARGNKIEELITDLKTVKDDSDREIRILKHKLTLTEGERDGFRTSLDQTQHLLQESKQSQYEQQRHLGELESQVHTFSVQKQELLDKLGNAENAIESLNSQLMEVGSSDTLARLREQQDTVVAGLQHKYEEEVLSLKQQLDAMTIELTEKTEGLTDSRKQVSNLTKDLEKSNIERGETVNKLSKSLEESQRQNRDLLDAGASQDITKLKIQVQEVIAGKSIAEDMNNAMQDEIKELKEQLTMYESASHFGIISTPGVSTVTALSEANGRMDDSYAQLGIKKVDGAAADSTVSDNNTTGSGNVSNYDQVHGLKRELERCLVMYKNKREQLTEVQAQLKEAMVTQEEQKHKMEKTEKELQETKVKLSLQEMSRSGASSLKEVRIQKEMDKVLTEKENLRLEYEGKLSGYVQANEMGASSLTEAKLKLDLNKTHIEKQSTLLQMEELRDRLEEVAVNEERLTEMNQELQAQMSQMVREYDEDKRQAVDKCREACLQHHDVTKDKLRGELAEQHQKAQAELIEAHKQEIEKLEIELKSIQYELDEVKTLYVSVCQAKDDLEHSLTEQWEEKLQQQRIQISQEVFEQKQVELGQLRETMVSEQQVFLNTQREKWTKAQENETARTLDIKLAEARVKWLEEQHSEKQAAIESAIKSTEERVKQEAEVHWREVLSEEQHLAEEKTEQAVQEAVQVAVQQAEQELEQKWEEILTEEQNKWEESMEDDAEHKLQEARLKWQTDKRVSFERELQERLKSAKDTWVSTELPQALETAQQTWHRDLLGDVPSLEEKVNRAVNDAKKEWRLKEKKHRDHSENKIRELSKLVVEVEAKVERANWDLKQELNQIRNDKKSLEKQLQEVQERHLDEKQQVLKEKEDEKKQAVKEVQEQSEQDYRVFIEEHQDTLNKALRSAREQHEKDRRDMISSHEEEMDSLKKKLDVESGNSKKLAEEKCECERQWQMKLEQLSTQHREDRESLMSTHQHNLHQSLEDARTKWQQHQEGVQQEREQLLQSLEASEEERERCQVELRRLEQLLQTADEHMETEIAKLHEELSEAHQKELDDKVIKEVAKVEADLTEKLNAATQEKQQMTVKLEDTRNLLKELEAKYKKDTSNLAEKARSYKHDLHSARKELEEKWQRHEVVESHKEEMDQKVKDLQKELEKSERTRQEIAESYRKSESEHGQIVDSYKARLNKLNEKIQLLEHELKSSQIEAQKQLLSMQESLEREQTAALDRMKAKISEMRANHKVALESARKEFLAEKETMLQELDSLRSARRSLTNTPTQTERNEINNTVLEEIKVRYLKTVSKMKQDVIKHVKNSNELAGETVKIEVLKERQKTAKRLRAYYLRSLSDMLDKDFDRNTREQKLKAMEVVLDNIPDSRATSRTTTPLGQMVTPRDQQQPPHASTGSVQHTPASQRSSHGGGGSVQHTPASQRSSHGGGGSVQHTPASQRSQSAVTGSSGHRTHSSSRHHVLDRVSHRSQSEDRHSASHRGRHHSTTSAARTSGGYFRNDASNESGSTATTLTPSETPPIDDIIRRVAALRDSGGPSDHHSSSKQRPQTNRTSNTTGNRRERESFKSRSDNNFGGGSDSSPPSRSYSMTSQDSLQFKNTIIGNFDDYTSNGRVPRNSSSSKRTSFGTVSKRSPSKHPSEPDLYHKFQSSGGSGGGCATRERKAFNSASISSIDSCADGSTTLPTDNGGGNNNRSSEESSGLGAHMLLSAPSSPSKTSPSKSKSGRYKYTSLRHTTGVSGGGAAVGGYGTLSKAMSTSNIDKSKSSSHLYDIPQSLFGEVAKLPRTYNPPAEKDSNSGSSTPTNLTKFVSQDSQSEQNRLRSHRTSALRKPTPKKASRSSSESRLPKSGVLLRHTNTNNNNMIQSAGSSFERYTPSEALSCQGSILGHTYTLEAEKKKEDQLSSQLSTNTAATATTPTTSTTGGGDSQVTGVRLSWDKTPASYNLTLYSNKHN